MPSFQIKDYIIAALLIVLLLSITAMMYYKADAADANSQLDKIKILKDEAERKNKLIAKRTEQERIEANEQYQNDITTLNAELKRMHDSRASLLPAITKASRYINEITFQRAELDRAIEEFREQIRGIAAKGAECEIEIKTLQTWWYNVESLYGNQ